MKEIIRIEWGVWYYYGDKDYMIDCCWDGELNISYGRILNMQQIFFNGGGNSDFNIPIREDFIDLEGNRWKSLVAQRPNFGIEGIRAEIEYSDESEIYINLNSQYVSFKMCELMNKKEISYHYGPKYSDLNIVVRLDKFNKYLYEKDEFAMMGKAENKYFYLVKPDDFKCKTVRHLRNDYELISPGSSSEAVFYIDNPQTVNGINKIYDFSVQTSACDVMNRKAFIYRKMPYSIHINGSEVKQGALQQLEIRENQLKVELDFICDGAWLNKGENTLTIYNNDDVASLLIQNVFIKETVGKELQVTQFPEWVIMNEEFQIQISLLHKLIDIKIEMPDGFIVVENDIGCLDKGFHSIRLIATKPCANAKIVVKSEKYSDCCVINQVIAVGMEDGIAAVGAETVLFVPINGDYLNFIKDLKYRNMGNYVLLRNEGNYISVEEWREIFSLCRESRIYFSLFSEEFPSEGAPTMPLKEKDKVARIFGKEYYLGIHYHEFSREIYGWGDKEPRDITASRNVKTSKERYLQKILETDSDISRTCKIFGEAVLAADYDYQSGVKIVMAETMTGNTSVLMACTRAAAKVHGKMWGMHIACNFHKMPVDFEQGKVWSQNLLLGYMYGASIIYDEQALYNMLHEVAYSKNDKLPADRQNRLIRFYRFLKSHPRRGKAVIYFSLAQGNNEIITGGLGNKSMKHVWGWHGPEKASYLYGTPEYGFNYINEFLPGVYLLPIPVANSVEFLKRYINPTPYGQVDIVGLESATMENLLDYKVLYVLTWNTMTEDIYKKLTYYVEAGGNLLIGLPQFAAEEDREFLMDMKKMKIYGDGQLEALLGIEILGRKTEISHIHCNSIKYELPIDKNADPVFSVDILKRKNVFVDVEDQDGNPVLIRNNIGKGSVTFINIWNYPGHAALKEFVSGVVRSLANQYGRDILIDNRDANYCVYEHKGMKIIYILSVDETKEGDIKVSKVKIGDFEFVVNVKNDEISSIILFKDLILINDNDDILFIDEVNDSKGAYSIKASGYGKCVLKVLDRRKGSISNMEFNFGNYSIKDILIQ